MSVSTGKELGALKTQLEDSLGLRVRGGSPGGLALAVWGGKGALGSRRAWWRDLGEWRGCPDMLMFSG